MPELPEVEIVAQGLRSRLIGRRIAGVEVFLEKLARPQPQAIVQNLPGQVVRSIGRKGKLLVWGLDEWLLAVHLKMTGTFCFLPPNEPPAKHTHLRFTFDDAPFELHYRDLRQFGWFHLLQPADLAAWPAWANLGPDALQISRPEFLDRLNGRRGRLKPLLLNQSFLAGLGNIYVDEVLHRAGLHPLYPAQNLTRAEGKRLFQAIGEVLALALEAGGSSVANFRDVEGQMGYFQTRHLVYHRQGQACPACGTEIERLKVSGRSSFFCPRCQKIGKWGKTS